MPCPAACLLTFSVVAIHPGVPAKVCILWPAQLLEGVGQPQRLHCRAHRRRKQGPVQIGAAQHPCGGLCGRWKGQAEPKN